MTSAHDRTVGLIAGLELTLVHLFNCLHHRQVMDRQEAVDSLRETADALPDAEESTPAKTVIHHIASTLASQGSTAAPETQDDRSPEEIRRTFRVIHGALSEPGSATQRRRPSPGSADGDDDGGGGPAS